MLKNLLFLFLFINSYYIKQEGNFLDKILNIESKVSKSEFLDIILKIEYDKAMIDAKKYLQLTLKAEKIAIDINDKKLLAKVYEAKSLAYHFSSKTELSIANNLKAGKLFEEINDIENFAKTYINLGWQIKNRDFEKALIYMQNGIKILEKNKPRSKNLIAAYNNYGALKQREKQLDSALFFHKKSLDLSIQSNDSIGIPFALTHIGEIFLKKKKYTEAENYFKKALNLREKRKDTYGITDSFLYLADLFYAKKNYNKAIFFFKKAEKVAIKNSYYPLRKYATEYLYKSYEKKYDINNAFVYFKLFTKLKDSILNKETNSKITELEIKFKTSEKEKKITHQKEKLLEKELVIKNRNLYSILLSSVLLILGIIFFSIYKRNQLKRKQLQKEIDLKDTLSKIKTQNRLQEQRLEISRDLHDNIGSQLTFIISSIDNLNYISKGINENIKDKLSSISSFTGSTIHELRDTIWAMKKSEISIEDLNTRVLSYVEKAKTATENIQFDIKQDIQNGTIFSSKNGMNIFRVIQEAINNSIKYAEASKISIYTYQEKGKLIFIVKDNGIGFGIKTVELGNGLANMEKRISEINGELIINTKINSGTEVKIIM